MRVAVSFLSKREEDMSLGKILEMLPKLEQAGIDTIQWDLMDGKYNPNNTLRFFAFDMMESIMENTKMGGETHLMVLEPWIFVDKIKNCCSLIIFHFEACKNKSDILKTIDKIKSCGKKVGVAIEPETSVESLYEYLEFLDTVLIMTVKTGYAGQSFIDMTDKIRKLVEIRAERNLDFEIEADGGVNDKTVGPLREAGCDAVNSASYILNNDFERAVKVLKGI